jgi:hypothetical protein
MSVLFFKISDESHVIEVVVFKELKKAIWFQFDCLKIPKLNGLNTNKKIIKLYTYNIRALLKTSKYISLMHFEDLS